MLFFTHKLANPVTALKSRMSLKPIIKSAREALDRKDYPYALQLCTDALAFEPDNYWLLVFKAVALGGEGKVGAALVEYSKAAKVQGDNATAFQVSMLMIILVIIFLLICLGYCQFV